MLGELEIEFLGKEIELRFGVTIEKLKTLSWKNELKRKIINWLYWNKSLNIRDILRIFNLSVRRGTNYYGCEYFFNTLSRIKHTVVYSHIQKDIKGRIVLNVFLR